jgi:small subunit ribosomal protein S16
MSVRIRFKRVGRPHKAFYRLVAIDRIEARDGKPIEILGTFNPRSIQKPDAIRTDRVHYWISTGAQPTDSVRFALEKAGVWDQVKPGAPVPVAATTTTTAA